jgi:hypothetical protein
LNYNNYVKKLFGKRFGLDQHLAYSIQFVELTSEQLSGPKPEASVPERLRAYIAEFDSGLTHDEYNSPSFSYRLLFKKKLVNRPGQADWVVEFIDPNSEIAKTIDKEYWVKKEVERPKYNASSVAEMVRKAGFPKFKVHHAHTNMWKSENARDPGKGYGVQVEGAWLWYDTWVKRCIELCEAQGSTYR